MDKGFLRQDAIWHKKTGNDKHGQPVYAAGVQIKVRAERKRRIVVRANGQQVISETEVMCNERVQEKDALEINGIKTEVLAAHEILDLDCKLDHMEVAI